MVIVEIKAVKCLLPEHPAQLIKYLKATGIEAGLLINFGNQDMNTNASQERKTPTSMYRMKAKALDF